jgi:hypothetical protein
MPDNSASCTALQNIFGSSQELHAAGLFQDFEKVFDLKEKNTQLSSVFIKTYR